MKKILSDCSDAKRQRHREKIQHEKKRKVILL